MKYKVGQKVCVVSWEDMPQDVMNSHCMNTSRIGEIGTIVKLLRQEMGINAYDIIFEDNKYPVYLFEPEFESVVKAGQQLLFDFYKE